MTVVDDVSSKLNEINLKIGFIKRTAQYANKDALFLAGDPDYTQLKVILDVQSDLLATLVSDLQTLTGA